MVPFNLIPASKNFYLLVNEKLYLLTNLQRLIQVTDTPLFKTPFRLRYTVVGIHGKRDEYNFTSRFDPSKDLLYATKNGSCLVGKPDDEVTSMTKCTERDLKLKRYQGEYQTDYYSLEHLIAISNEETNLTKQFTQNTYVMFVDSHTHLKKLLLIFFGAAIIVLVTVVLVAVLFYISYKDHKNVLHKKSPRSPKEKRRKETELH
ncbi:unnamed protein product [Bursaphelenchus okinawaensis]|uniref:Uncharacterized protein n=1 Tax=Bursaphelenchus okinawaensis TaxID=465554 RepID=A0A811K9W6_9BILA|nr:unnamed protein product [Bursaphelenchus okinawaensis]CAG9098517.1 unnamed protein product [Bursaphelenchus okinawaensis]